MVIRWIIAVLLWAEAVLLVCGAMLNERTMRPCSCVVMSIIAIADVIGGILLVQ